MDPLPWLLDWPPSRRAVVVFLLLTAFSLGTVVLFEGGFDDRDDENVTVEATDLSVRLNDEFDVPDTGGTVETCLGMGTPGDSVSVLGDVTAEVPAEGYRDQVRDGSVAVVVELVEVGETTTESVDRTGTVTEDVFWVLDDDETLAVGNDATLQVRVRAGDATVASATRTVTVENGSRSYDC